MTFVQVADMFIAGHEGSWRSLRHRQQWHNTLDQYVLPVVGAMAIADVTIAEVMRILEPLWVTRTETASRVRGRIEAVLDYAKARGWREAENCARWKGCIGDLLPPRRKAQRVVHHPALSWREAGPFMQRLRQNSSLSARCLEFLILTATRSSEARFARWEEFDLDHALWTIPETRTKSGRPHRVPLSAPAMEVLRAMALLGTEGLVFPGLRSASALSGMALARTVHAAGGNGATPHGMRSCFRTWVAESTGFPRELAETALGHVLNNQVEAAYMRSDMMERRRTLMTRWGEFCAAPLVAGEVVPLRAAT